MSLDIAKLAQLIAEQQEAPVEAEETNKVAAETESTDNSQESLLKTAAELTAFGHIIAFGIADKLEAIAKQAGLDPAKTGPGGAGSVALQKGDALPNNTAAVPADEAGVKLKEKDIKQSPNPVASKGDSQGKGMSSFGAKKASLDSLSKALRGVR